MKSLLAFVALLGGCMIDNPDFDGGDGGAGPDTALVFDDVDAAAPAPTDLSCAPTDLSCAPTDLSVPRDLQVTRRDLSIASDLQAPPDFPAYCFTGQCQGMAARRTCVCTHGQWMGLQLGCSCGNYADPNVAYPCPCDPCHWPGVFDAGGEDCGQ